MSGSSRVPSSRIPIANDALEDDSASDPAYLAIGKLGAPHGVQGYLRVHVLTDFPERFSELKKVCVGEEFKPYRVADVRLVHEEVLLKLRGINTPEAARELVHNLIYVPTAEAVPLPEGEYYCYQIIGLAVEDEHGDPVGEVVDVFATGSNDVYVVRDGESEYLLPAIEDVVLGIDLSQRKIRVRLLEGLR